jgi:hypothetical protein
MLKEIRLEEDSGYEYQTYKETLNRAMKAEDEVIQELLDYSQPVTIDNLDAAMLIMSEGNELFRKLNITARNASNKDDGSDYEDILTDSEEFVDGLSDHETAVNLYDKIIKSSRTALDDYIYDTDNSYIDIKAAQVMYKQLSLMSGLSYEENYHVPMEIGGEMTNVNLKIYHNKAEFGKVAVTLNNKTIGKIAAEFQVDDNKITGMVVCENQNVKNQLNGLSDNLKEAFADKKVNISLVESDSIDLHKFGDDIDTNSKSVTTGQLYRTAKTLLKSINNIGGKSNENKL